MIKLDCNAMGCDMTTTTTMMTKGADDHNKEDPQGGKYLRTANVRRRD